MRYFSHILWFVAGGSSVGVLLIAPKETRETGMFDKDDNFVKYLECLGSL